MPTINKYPIQQLLPEASQLLYGCMGLGGGWTGNPPTSEHYRQAHQVIDAALEAGINFFDHADIYCLGNAELVFGRVLAERPELREQIFIQSKCGIRFADEQGPKRYDLSKAWISQSVDQILQRLNTDYLDILLLHRPDPLMEAEEIAEVFSKLKNSGKVKHFGVSNMHGLQVANLQSYLDEPLVVNQLEMHLQNLGWLNEGVYAGNPAGSDINFTEGTLEYCRKNNIQVQSWGSLSQGLFSGRDITNEPNLVKQVTQLVAELADKYQLSSESMILSWLMRHPVNLQPIVGTTNLERIAACAKSVEVKISREDWYALYVCANGEELP